VRHKNCAQWDSRFEVFHGGEYSSRGLLGRDVCHPEHGGNKILRSIHALSHRYTASQTGIPRLAQGGGGVNHDDGSEAGDIHVVTGSYHQTVHTATLSDGDAPKIHPP